MGSVVAPPSASAAPAPTYDLSQVPVPEGLVATIRFSHPVSSIDRANAFLDGLFTSGTKRDPLDVDDLAKLVTDAPIGGALDLDAPVDVAVFGPGKNVDGIGAVVASAALRPGNAAMSTIASSFEIVPGPDGMLFLRARRDQPPPADDADGTPDPAPEPFRCVVAPAFGPAARRLVCAFGSSAIESLAPFMTRTLTRAPASKSDMHAELHLSSELDKLEDMADDAAPKDDVDPETERRLRELYAHFREDLDSLAFDVGFQQTSFDLGVSLRFRAKGSQLTRLVLSGNDAAGPPPDAFFRLPIDSSFAFFSRGSDPKDLAPMRDIVFGSIEHALVEDGAPRKVIDATVGALKSVVLTGGPLVIGSGHDDAAARAALATYVAGGKDTIAARSAARSALQGWWIAGVDEPSAKWIDAWKKMAAADAVPYTPKKKPKPDSKSDKETSKLVVVPLPAGSPLPKDTLHVEVRTTPKKGVVDPPLAHVQHFFIVPDGARTWLAMGENVKLVTEHVRAAMSGAPDSGTLKARAGIDRLRAGAMTSGGFVTFAALVAAWVGDTSDKDLKSARDTLDTLAQLKSGGKDPMLLLASPDRAAPQAGGGRSYELAIPRSAIADAVQQFNHTP